jgi:hypothetical protein
MRDYASIAILDCPSSDLIAVEVISVTKDSCDLAGAWLISIEDLSTLDQIIEGRLLVKLNLKSGVEKSLNKYASFVIDFDDFLAEAKSDAEKAIYAYEEFMIENERTYREYMTIKPAERKLLPKVVKKQLVAPEFSQWPSDFDILKAEKFFESINKKGLVNTVDTEMKGALLASRATKYLIDMWRFDEMERANRIYVEGNEANISILPTSWLSKIPKN